MPARGKYRANKPKSAQRKKQEQVAKQVALKVMNQNVEWKHTTKNMNYGVGTTGQIDDLSAVPAGTADTNRTGDLLQAYSLNFRGAVSLGDATNVFRLIFFQWHPKGTPTLGNILIVTAGYEVFSMYNTDQGDQYKIMYDRTFNLNKSGGGNNEVKVFSGKISVPRKKLQYDAGLTTGSNHIYSLLISDSGAPTDPNSIMVTKLNFRDN